MGAQMHLIVLKAVALKSCTGRTLVDELARMFSCLYDVFAQIVEAAALEFAVGTFMGLLSGMSAHVAIEVTLDSRFELALIAREPFATLSQL